MSSGNASCCSRFVLLLEVHGVWMRLRLMLPFDTQRIRRHFRASSSQSQHRWQQQLLRIVGDGMIYLDPRVSLSLALFDRGILWMVSPPRVCVCVYDDQFTTQQGILDCKQMLRLRPVEFRNTMMPRSRD